MSVVVIGKSGQLAIALAEEATAVGMPITSLARPAIDLMHPDMIEPKLAALKPCVVINAAAYTRVDQAEKDPGLAHMINAEAPGKLAEFCQRLDAGLIHVSTDYVFDGNKAGAYCESDAPCPVGVYGATKLEGEVRVAQACPRHIIVRTAWLHSPYGRNFVRTMLKLAAERGEVSVVADQFGNPTYVRHLAQGIIAIAGKVIAGQDQPWGIYHAAGSGRTSWSGFAEKVFARSRALGGPDASVNAISSKDFAAEARRPANSELDCTRLQQAFGLRLPNWKIGVEECVEQILNTGAALPSAKAEVMR